MRAFSIGRTTTAAFSVGGELEDVLSYVRRQKEHHASGDLWTEWEESYEEV